MTQCFPRRAHEARDRLREDGERGIDLLRFELHPRDRRHDHEVVRRLRERERRDLDLPLVPDEVRDLRGEEQALQLVRNLLRSDGRHAHPMPFTLSASAKTLNVAVWPSTSLVTVPPADVVVPLLHLADDERLARGDVLGEVGRRDGARRRARRRRVRLLRRERRDDAPPPATTRARTTGIIRGLSLPDGTRSPHSRRQGYHDRSARRLG